MHNSIFIHQTLYLDVTLHANFCQTISFTINLLEMVKIQDGGHFCKSNLQYRMRYPISISKPHKSYKY